MAQKKSILVVDDEIGPRESLRMILKTIYDVHTAADGIEALQYISKEKVDLVTLDLNMPGLSGIEVLRAIRKMNPNIGVIVITGYGTEKNIQEASKYGATHILCKPYNVPEVITIVNQSVDRQNESLKSN
jgi:putative two-component system response regulator